MPAERVAVLRRGDVAPDRLRLARVECTGVLPVFFAPIGDALPLHVTAHAVEESRP